MDNTCREVVAVRPPSFEELQQDIAQCTPEQMRTATRKWVKLQGSPTGKLNGIESILDGSISLIDNL